MVEGIRILYITTESESLDTACNAARKAGEDYVKEHGAAVINLFITPIEVPRDGGERLLYGLAIFGSRVPPEMIRALCAAVEGCMEGPIDVHPSLWDAIEAKTREQVRTGRRETSRSGVTRIYKARNAL